ncbi:hypothetical protein AQZ59_01652 [Trueperella bernardiae]|uniref:DUF58 domain-containing protein n=1 Tax=Trueperella bernardiae TaxID=59561 RepID=A0A0W1KHU6_9ACTO|nr:hypothetical protein AQZ59_01652 [Trueperella bernardiae]OCW60192.1 hypothetical protein AKG36_05410 [Trueperella bernardiae]
MSRRVRSTGTRSALVRAKVSLPVIRRASGVFEGQHSSMLTGQGHDFDDLTDYVHGDDVADIDWKTSARAGRPIIRRFERETDMFTQLVVDTGAEMRAAAPSGESKEQVAMFAADVLGYLAIQRGDRLSVVYGDSAGVSRIPARNGNSHLDFALDAVQERMEAGAGESAVSDMLEERLRVPQPRALLVLVTDEYWPGLADGHTLRRIRTRHEVVVLRVADMSVAAQGVEHMVDHATGSLIPEFLRDDAALRADLEEERRRAHAFAAELLRANGVRHVTVGSTEEVPRAIIELLRRHA